jgi:magnesium-protoporphyrin O-methyltransferase
VDTALGLVRETSTVLDLCCGCGAIGHALARAAECEIDVWATDVDPVSVAYAETPHFPLTAVSGHPGRLIAGKIERKRVLLLQGRAHYYETGDAVSVLAGLAQRTRRGLLFTYVPSSPALEVFRAVGKLFPRGDRSPAVVPVTERRLQQRIDAHPQLRDWARGRTERVSSGFYTSQALELIPS